MVYPGVWSPGVPGDPWYPPISTPGTLGTRVPSSQLSVAPNGFPVKGRFSAVFRCFPLFSVFSWIQAALAYPFDGNVQKEQLRCSDFTFHVLGL